ncbi:MAG TPA: DUF72 domain-containing protein, partial [Candidatus Hodarchaeales archaeon]|nr:DUF72 domain-containing protein [Candidatus Hodarchaeales archaeon]
MVSADKLFNGRYELTNGLLRIGTSGYSYADWRGTFYPKTMKSTEYLKFYAKYFDTVEIDSVYYGIPSPRVFEEISRKVPSNFRFSVKTPSTFTHDIARYDETLEHFRRSVNPIQRKGLIECILAQFPYSFKTNPDSLAHIKQITNDIGDLAHLCVEFRNIEWQTEDTTRFLKDIGVGYVNVDLPRIPNLPVLSSIFTSDIGYFRFHGRVDEKIWWTPAKSYDRYNYEYRHGELLEMLPYIKRVEEKTKTTYAFFNNHQGGKSARAAL